MTPQETLNNLRLTEQALACICKMDDIETLDEQLDVCEALRKLKRALLKRTGIVPNNQTVL